MRSGAFCYQNKQRIQDHNLGITRTEVYCCRTSRVPQSEYEATLTGLQKIISETEVGLKIVDYGNYNLGNKPFLTPDWYQQKALTTKDKGLGLQVDAIQLYMLLRKEPFQQQNPHFDLMIIDKDMTMIHPQLKTENNFIFGFGAYPNNIISVKRFHSITDPILRQKCLAIMTAHEFGHNLDLVERDFNTGSGEYKKGHCSGNKEPCLMEQVNVPGTRSIEEQTKILINRYNWLCPDCKEEVEIKKELQKQMRER